MRCPEGLFRRLALGCLAVSLALPATAGERPARPSAARFSEDQLLLLQVKLKDYVLADGLTAYREGPRVFVPLGELCRLLGIGVESFPEQGTAGGFVLDEHRTFALELKTTSVILAGERKAFDPSLVTAREDDLYVEAKVFSLWFPVILDVDTSGLLLNVVSREKLPIEIKLEREKRFGAPRQDGNSADPGYVNHSNAYALIDRPMVDANLLLDAHRNGAVASYSSLITGDLLGFESMTVLGGSTQSPLSAWRLTLGKSDPEPVLLGPLGARSYSFVKVALPGIRNVSSSDGSTLGGMLTNRPFSRPERYDAKTFRGEMPAGWDVELFHNGVPIRHLQAGADGQYSFEEVPLLFGQNDFTLSFYGPLGQRQEKHYEFLLDDSLTRPGEFLYTAGSGVSPDGDPRSAFQLDLGLANGVSATASGTLLNLNGARREFGNLGARASLESVFLAQDATLDDQGGWLAETGLRTRLLGISLGANHAFLKNFVSETLPETADPLAMRTELKSTAYLPFWQRLPVTLNYKRDAFVSGAHKDEVSSRVSTFLLGLSVSHDLKVEFADSSRFTKGQVQLGRKLGRFAVRGGFEYQLEPAWTPLSADLNADTRLGNGYLLSQSLQSQLTDDSYRYQIAFNKSIGSFGFGATAGYGSAGDSSVGLRLFIGLGMEPRQSTVSGSSQPIAMSGGASARVYLDRNRNDVFDAGDEPLAGVGFVLDGAPEARKTDKDGIVFFDRLPARQYCNLGVDLNTLADPQWNPKTRGIRFLPRPGKVTQVDFPVVTTTEIEGTIRLADAQNHNRPAGNVELELLDRGNHDQLVAVIRSSADGYFVFTGVAPGRYFVRMSEAQAKRLKIASRDIKTVAAFPDGGIIGGQDFLLRHEDTPLPPADGNPAPALARSLQKSADGRHAILVGEFRAATLVDEALALLKSYGIRAKVTPVKRRLRHFWNVVLKTRDWPLAQPRRDLLKEYGLEASILTQDGEHLVITGPHASAEKAGYERGSLVARFPETTELVIEFETKLTRVEIPGFRSREEAEAAQAALRNTEFRYFFDRKEELSEP